MLITSKATYRLSGSLTAVPLAGAERLSRAYLSCLRRAGRGPQLRRAASGLCALRESPEQCELGAERARPMGVTSLRCLIRRSACAARAAGAPVTARPAVLAAQQCARLLRRSDLRNGPWVPGRPQRGMGGGPGTLARSSRANQVIGGHGRSACTFLPLLWGSKASIIT